MFHVFTETFSKHLNLFVCHRGEYYDILNCLLNKYFACYFLQGMYSCCNFEDERDHGCSQSTLPQYHHVSTVPPPPPPHVISTAMANPTITKAQQQQQQQKQHHQQPPPVYNTLLPGSPPSGGHSGMALGPSNSPILGAPMPCSTFLPRHDRRLAVVDRWTRPKVGPEKPGGVSSGITDLTQFQGMPPHWGAGITGGDGGLDEYKRYYGPIDPEGLGVSAEPQNMGTQTPKTKHRGIKSSGNPRLPPKGQASGHLPINPALPHPSPPHQSIWRRSSFSKRKGSGPLYENILPLGRRGGGRYEMRDAGGRRGRRPPPLPLPIPVPLSSPTQTPPSPSPSICYTSTSSSSSSTSSSSSSTESVSRSNSPSSSSSYTSSQSFRYRTDVQDMYEDYDTDELTEESSLLLGRRKSRSRMSSRSLPSSPPPPPIPPRKPWPQRAQVRDRAGSQLAQLQEWWASWGEKEKGRRAAGDRNVKEEKRHHKERERERKRRKKGRKKKKREERERERERKRRKVKKKKKKEEKSRRREREKRPEQEEVDVDRKDVFEKGIGQECYSYPALRRSSFRKKSESSTKSYEWDIIRDGVKRDRDDQGGDNEEGSRGKERHHRSPKSLRHSRPRSNNKHFSTSNKPSSTVKFWGSGNPTSESPSPFVPLLPITSKRRKSVGAERDEHGRAVESRPLLENHCRGKPCSREGLSFHEWESEEEDEESEVERSRPEEQGRRRESRGMNSESERDREKTVEIYTDDEGSSGEFGKFERYWEGHEGRAVGGIGGGGWFFGTYPARERGSSINSRDDSFLGLGGRESSLGLGAGTGWGSGGLGSNQCPPTPLTPPPPRRYWSVDKLPVKTEKKSKSRSQEKSRGHTSCSCQSPHHSASTHSKWNRVTSRSQEELLPHCHSFSSSVRPKRQSSKPDRAQSQAKSGSQSNINAQRPQRSDRSRQPPSPPQSLPPSLPSPMVPALPAPPSSSHHIHAPPPTSSSSVSSPSVISSTPGAPQPSSLSSSSAKLQYQKLRSVPQPQRYQSPHLPLKTKSLCSRRGSAQFSSVESEV